MISAKKGIFHIKNRETGEFEPIVAVKGDKGDGADIVAMDKYFTTETGDSEELVMTQKGVTDLHSDIVNGETKVGVATLADRATEADLADLATSATGDAKGNVIDKTYAKLTKVNGSALSTNILEKAIELVGNGESCKIEHRFISISDAEWINGDFDIPEGNTRYGYVTFFIRYGSVTVWLWGALGSSAYHNSYSTSTKKWTGWRKVIDSKNIGEQSVSHAKTADNATTANRATKITASVTNEDAEHLVYLTGNNDASVMKYDTALRYNPSTRTLTVPNINGTASKATEADHADKATNATNATNATYVSVPLTLTITNDSGMNANVEIISYIGGEKHRQDVVVNSKTKTSLKTSADLGSYLSVSNNIMDFSNDVSSCPVMLKFPKEVTYKHDFQSSYIILGGGTVELTISKG